MLRKRQAKLAVMTRELYVQMPTGEVTLEQEEIKAEWEASRSVLEKLVDIFEVGETVMVPSYAEQW